MRRQAPRRAFAILLAGTLALLARPAGAAADDDSRISFELGIFGGAHIFSRTLELGVIDDPASANSPKDGPLLGLRAGLGLGPWMALELELVGIPTADRRDDRSAYILGYRANAVVHLASGALQPFLLVGGGLMHVVASGGDASTGLFKESDGEAHAGLGLRYQLRRSLTLRADARAIMAPDNRERGYTADWEFQAGVVYTFGRRPAAPAAAEAPAAIAPGKPAAQAPVPTPAPRAPPPAPQPPAVPVPPATAPAPAALPGPRAPEAPGATAAPSTAPPVAEKQAAEKPVVEKPAAEKPAAAAGSLSAADLKLSARGIRFEEGSARLNAASVAAVEKLASALRASAGTRIQVAGHTADHGDRDKDLALSRKRADAIRDLLVGKGVEPGRVEAAGFGSDKPLVPSVTRRGRERNERIELRLLSK